MELSDNTTQVLNDVLTQAIRAATGNPTAGPRDGQGELTADIYQALVTRTHHASVAPTGSGKSFSGLVPAMVRAVTARERTAISTESLSLQDQIINKDAPTVAGAVEKVTGVRPTFAVHKGWSNYVCIKSVVAAIEDATGSEPAVGNLAEAAEGVTTEIQPELLSWAATQIDDPNAVGDRHSVPHQISAKDWADVSVSPAECVGVTKCPFADVCKAAKAKTKASQSDIVVTNHSLLAVQAAKGVTAVVGSKSLGRIDHLVVDEAHALVPAVRNAGAGEVSSRRLLSLVRAAGTVIADATMVSSFEQGAHNLASTLDQVLLPYVGAKTPITPQVIEDIAEDVRPWIKSIANVVKQATANAGEAGQMKARRVLGRLESADGDLREAVNPEAQLARWVEQNGTEVALKFSPVQVSNAIDQKLWHAEPVDDDEYDELVELGVMNGVEDTYPLGVATISATLARSFTRDAGIASAVIERPSPFSVAYANSALFVPQAVSDMDVNALNSVYGTMQRPRLDTKKHAQWARPIAARLVEQAGGRALILCATAADGRDMAEYLRLAAAGRWMVLDQWCGLPAGTLVKQWREDETSVLVGTRSLMTGVDAPGDTCKLVVIDRVPRSPSNPVDEARVEAFCAATGQDKWTGDRAVYVSDAALLLEQAAGRLIRSTTDSGMVAVLDPRLLKPAGSKFNYPGPTRDAYLHALRHFPVKISDLNKATGRLTGAA